MGILGNLFKKSKKSEVEVVPQEDALEPKVKNEHIPGTLDLGWYYSDNQDQIQMAKIAEKDRATHFYIIGATGAGKTKFLEFLIQQDIANKNGFGVIDPHGDLIEDIKGFLAGRYRETQDVKELAERVVLIDPTDPNFTVTFNPLEKLPNVSAAEQAGELVNSFKKIWTDSWGVRMEDLMRNSLIALGETEADLADLPHFLTNRGFRQSLTRRVAHPIARNYFQRFDTITDRSQITWIEPVMNKINAFLADERIRQMFSHSKSTFNFREILDRKKILLIKLDKGRLKDSADLLGSLLLAKIQMAAFSRSDIPQSKRTPFYLYVDEFQNFASESFAVVLSEARKYGLSLIMAHQTLAQISDELRSLILGNTGIQVYFRINRQDAQTLAKEAFSYSGYEVKTVNNLHPIFWSLGEEWEKYTEELQSLPPRCCYVKHKIEGGIIPIRTADIQPARDSLGMEEDKCREYMKSLPFGKKYLLARKELAVIEKEKSRLLEEKTEIITVEKPKKVEATSKPALRERKEPIVIPKVEKRELPVNAEKTESQHRYLQSLLRKMAEEKGYKATIEEPTPDGQGRIDISLAREGKKVAIEISVTTTDEHELANIEKCLAAGYEKVILCSPDKKILERVKELTLHKLKTDDFEKVSFFQPEEVIFYLEEAAAVEASKEQRVKGYKVKVQYQPIKESDKKTKREAIANVILQALRRQKQEK